MDRIAVFPGSFDPITVGHVEIVKKGLCIFDKVVVGIGVNTTKQYRFPLDLRKKWIEQCFDNDGRVKVVEFSTLTIDLAKAHGARYLLRGLRSVKDFEYERSLYSINRHLDNDIESIYMFSSPQYSDVSSTLIRELIRYDAKIEGLVPDPIIEDIHRYIAETKA